MAQKMMSSKRDLRDQAPSDYVSALKLDDRD